MILTKEQVGVCGRHCHLTQEHILTLFGKPLTIRNELRQPGFFAANETVTLMTGGKALDNVRVLGPSRMYSQVEISRTDANRLNVAAPVRISGDLWGTPGCVLIGPNGAVELLNGLIVPARHVHLDWNYAAELDLGVHNGESVSLVVKSPRSMVFHDLITVIDSRSILEVHIDVDEANACDITRATEILLAQ